MSRRRKAIEREIRPDSKFNSVTLAKFINKLMYEGKKSISEKLVYDALQEIEEKHNMKGIEAFNTAVENIRPQVELKSRRIGGSNYQVPTECRLSRSYCFAYKWLIAAMRARSERGSFKKLAAEIFDAVNKRGAAIKKREDNHKMAEANKAFSHYNQ
jgi:small subunit ribosomal protein S7